MYDSAITFETWSPPQPADPARMDVACFVGFVAERPDAALSPILRAELKRTYKLSDSDLLAPNRLLNRPVTLTSASEFEDIFDADTRLEQRAIVIGGELPDTLPGSGIEPLLHVVIDGIIHDVDLNPLPTSPVDLVERLDTSGLGLEVSLTEHQALRLALPAGHGPGTLAVLANPHYGFPDTRRARARAIPSALGQAVRQFFANGGRKAVVVRMGDPIPYDVPRVERYTALIRLMARNPEAPAVGPADVQSALAADLPPPVIEATERYGITQAYGLVDTTFLMLPDLPELVSPPPGLAAVLPEPDAPEAAFAECLPAAGDMGDAAGSAYLAPQTDTLGLSLWRMAVDRALDMLRTYQRDKLIVAALPRLAPDIVDPQVPESAFLQLAEGWVRSDFSRAAPGGLMAPDAALAGHLAGATLLRGAYLSAAALPLSGIRDVEGAQPSGLPTCRIMRTRSGFALSADLTTSDDAAWADAPVSRLMALLFRQSRELGEDLVFEPSNSALWARIEGAMRGLLEAALAQGALAGEGEGDSYTVRCDATTMSQQDIDAGRLIAEITFRPTIPVARIRVRLPVSGDPGQVTGVGGPA